jgi:hypothetical protein
MPWFVPVLAPQRDRRPVKPGHDDLSPLYDELYRSTVTTVHWLADLQSAAIS